MTNLSLAVDFTDDHFLGGCDSSQRGHPALGLSLGDKRTSAATKDLSRGGHQARLKEAPRALQAHRSNIRMTERHRLSVRGCTTPPHFVADRTQKVRHSVGG